MKLSGNQHNVHHKFIEGKCTYMSVMKQIYTPRRTLTHVIYSTVLINQDNSHFGNVIQHGHISNKE